MKYRSPDILPDRFVNHAVFIAGGISDCADWQADVVNIIDCDTFDVVNPRRIGGFDKTGATAEEQITWEHTALGKVDSYLFWFPKESICPIGLFELGMALERVLIKPNPMIIIGWHEEYPRAFDLKIQTKLAKFNTYAQPGWEKFCSAVRAYYS